MKKLGKNSENISENFKNLEKIQRILRGNFKELIKKSLTFEALARNSEEF